MNLHRYVVIAPKLYSSRSEGRMAYDQCMAPLHFASGGLAPSVD